jgi:hypothetical protein
LKSLSLGQAAALPDFDFTERGGAKIWVNRTFYSEELLELIADCDRLLARPDCRIIKDQEKIKVGRLTLGLASGQLKIYIKRYNAFSLRYRIGSLLLPSGAVRSLRGATILKGAGIETVKPIAAVESRLMGMVCKSFFITEEISTGKTADAYWIENLRPLSIFNGQRCRREFIAKLATLFRNLHDAAIYHNDLKDANIIAVPVADRRSETFYLLDLDGVRRFASLSERHRMKNLVQINRTLGKYLTRSERWYFLNFYLKATGVDRKTAKRWAKDIHLQSIRLNQARRHAFV